MPIRHFLELSDLTSDEVRELIARGIQLKAQRNQNETGSLMKNKTAVLIFEKSSTRTRVSFEAGINQLGGSAIFMTSSDSQLSRGEPIEDTARVLSRMVDLIIMRTGSHENLVRMAEHASIPVVNALSDFNHPCQQLADIQTFMEHRGDLRGHKVAWIGDGNNVCHSWMNAAKLLDFELVVATPEEFEPDADLLAHCGDHVTLTRHPTDAAQNSSLVVTDTWTGMGQETEKAERENAFSGFCVDQTLMSLANKDALFMHCLPAYRGYEVTSEVIDGPQSVVWDEAENRLHAQKALMEFLLLQTDSPE
ncbi:MAG: ornithine carbamoyltransferase [Gammaproteobacteria bacterium]|nr:ornithine carbamoyltransferase [Gammaproteobacteria bacterium]